jgi:hypothetical protein
VPRGGAALRRTAGWAVVAGAVVGAVASMTATRLTQARPVDLAVRQLPSAAPRLTMRSATASMSGSGSGSVSVSGSRSGSGSSSGSSSVSSAGSASGSASVSPRLEERVVFRFNLGFGIDGGKPSGNPLTSGAELDEVRGYDRLRAYGFGDVAVGSRGLLSPPLATYLAASFRFDQPLGQATGAVPSVHDHPSVADLIIRSGYAEVAGFLAGRLRPLYMRAGRQYRYGVAVAQFDGVSAGYESAALSLSGFAGERVFSWSTTADPLEGSTATGSAIVVEQPAMAGFQARLDLFELRRIPLVVNLDGLQFDGHSNLEAGLALRWSPDVVVRASMRTRDGEAARQGISLWARLSAVTTLNLELDRRSSGDWMYDLLAAGRGRTADDLRRYLDLGAPVPRTLLDVRAGTVLLSNLDLVLRGGAGVEHGADDEPASAFSAGYVEAGGAVEVRLRRNLRLGTSLSARRYRRHEVVPADDGPAADPLPSTAAGLGERAVYEGGTRIHYSAGARRFNAWAEMYGRAYALQSPWMTPADDETDLRTGSRFGVEAWARNRLRIRGEYDVSLTSLRPAPELLGVKSLRVLAEGSF